MPVIRFEQLLDELMDRVVEDIDYRRNSEGDICEIIIYTLNGKEITIKSSANSKLIFEDNNG